MADTRISGLTSVAPADADYVAGVDVSDTTQSAQGTTKRFTFTNVWAWIVSKFDDTAHGSRGGGSLHANVVAGGAAGFMTGADKTKLDGVASGSEVNQNAFSTVAVSGQSDVVADAKTDTLTLAAGANITITTNAGTDTVTIAASGGGAGIAWSDAVNADVVPDADGTRDLGSSANRFAELHVDTIDLNGVTFSGSSAISDPGADGVMTWDDSQAAGSEIGIGTYGQGLTQSGRNPQVTDNVMFETIAFVIDGGGSTITTGIKGYLPIDFGCTILEVEMLADQSGSIVIDIWKDTYANFPPLDADSITASAVPTISTAVKAQDATLTGWTTSITAGDILAFNVDSVTSIQRVTVALKVKKT